MPSIFEEVKAQVTMRQAIDFLRLGQPADVKGNQWRWKCPKCGGNDDRSLSVNLDKGYGCWVGASGNKPAHSGNDCIALAAHVLGITQTEAAKQLKEHFIGQQRAPSAPKAPDGGGELQALDYLVHEHEVAQMLGLSATTCAALGAGYAPRGTMAGRILLPLRLPNGTLIGYCGIATKGDQEPLLLFPSNLDQACKVTSKPEDIRSRLRVVS